MPLLIFDSISFLGKALEATIEDALFMEKVMTRVFLSFEVLVTGFSVAWTATSAITGASVPRHIDARQRSIRAPEANNVLLLTLDISLEVHCLEVFRLVRADSSDRCLSVPLSLGFFELEGREGRRLASWWSIFCDSAIAIDERRLALAFMLDFLRPTEKTNGERCPGSSTLNFFRSLAVGEVGDFSGSLKLDFLMHGADELERLLSGSLMLDLLDAV